jgi:hypothetical protein
MKGLAMYPITAPIINVIIVLVVFVLFYK